MRHIQSISSSRTTPAPADLTVLGARSLVTLLAEITSFASAVSSLVKGLPVEASTSAEPTGDHDE